MQGLVPTSAAMVASLRTGRCHTPRGCVHLVHFRTPSFAVGLDLFHILGCHFHAKHQFFCFLTGQFGLRQKPSLNSIVVYTEHKSVAERILQCTFKFAELCQFAKLRDVGRHCLSRLSETSVDFISLDDHRRRGTVLQLHRCFELIVALVSWLLGRDQTVQ